MMQSEQRFRLRFFLAALLAPLALPVITLAMSEAVSAAYGTTPRWPDLLLGLLLVYWLATSAAVAAGGMLLWKVRKVRLRHHLLLGLAIGFIPVAVVIFGLVDLLNYLPGSGEQIVVPYPCVELVRHETLDLPGAVSQMLMFSLLGILFKWGAYGFTHEPTATGWKLAGGAYILAWTMYLIEPFHIVNRNIPSWTHLVSEICGRAIQ